jgi:integrase
VSELSRLKAADLDFRDGTIFISVKHGKGGSNGIVECLNDPYLYHNLQEYIGTIHEAGAAGNLFYSRNHMCYEANRLNIECHDFRRIFAINLRSQLKNEGKSTPEANTAVKEQLRHKRFSTTKRYLYNRKLKVTSGKGG